MSPALGALKQRTVVTLICGVLLCLLIWFVGPYVAFEERRPFESAEGRVATILIVLAIWALVIHWRQWRVLLSVSSGLLALLGLIGLTISYRANQTYLRDVLQAAMHFREGDDSADRDLNSAIERMDRLREVVDAAEKFQNDVPWSMRWGLYQGKSIGEAARSAYFLELNDSLLPFAGRRLEQRVSDLAADPDGLYEYFKAYLMLADPRRVEHNMLLQVMQAEWKTLTAAVAGLSERLDSHFNALISDPLHMRPYPASSALIARSRVSLQRASLPRLMYRRLVMNSATKAGGDLHLDKELGPLSDLVFVRRSGKPLSDPIPAIYTRAAFTDYLLTGRLTLSKQFVEDAWILGDSAPTITTVARASEQVLALYEQDYIRFWDDVLADLRIRRTSSPDAAVEVMKILGSPASPLRRLLELTEANTNLARPAAPSDRLAGAPVAVPGQSVAQHFLALNAFVAGSPAPIDRTLAYLSRAAEGQGVFRAGVGQGVALSGVDSRALTEEAPQLPPVVAEMFRDSTKATGARH